MSPSSAYRVSSRSPAARRLAMCVTAFCAALLPARQACAGDSTLAFSSASQIVTSTGMVTSASFTFEAWFRYTGYITENQVLGQYAGGNAGRMILAIHNGKMGFFIGGTWLDGATTVPSNVWTHVAVTRSGTTGQVFLNGALDRSSASFPSTALAQTGISIGNISLLQNGFRGQIADVRAWNLVRTQAEIQSNMYKRLRGDEAGLAHYWALNDGYGSSAANRVAPAPGTITGAAWAYDAQFPIVSTDPVGAWISSAGGAWSVAGNWAASTPAAGVNGTAYFTNALAGSIIVNNDVASQQLGNLVFSGSAAHTLSGNALTLSNDFVVSRVTSLSGTGSRTLSLPLVTTHRGLLLDTAAPGALVVSGALSGPGAVAINAAATGGGSVTLTGANTYTGPTRSTAARSPSPAQARSARLPQPTARSLSEPPRST